MRLSAGLALLALVLVTPAQTIVGTYRQNDIAGLRSAVAKDPKNIGLRLRLSQALLRPDKKSAHPDRAKARLDEAQSQFRLVLEINPNAVIPLRVMALDAYARRSLESAVEFGRKLLKISPTDTEVAQVVLKSLLRLSRHDDAAQFCVEWLVGGATPSFGAIQGLLSTMLLSNGFRDALGPRLVAAVKARPKDVELRLYHAIFLVETGRNESAWGAVHEAEMLGLCDTRTGSRHAFCRILASRAREFEPGPGAFEGGAPDAFSSFRQGHPKHTGLAMRHARLLDMGGRQKEALRAYGEVRQLNPDYWPAWYRSGQLLLGLGRAAEAAEQLSRARELFPAHLLVRLTAAEAWVKAGKPDRAIKILERVAVRHDPGKRSRAVIDLLRTASGIDGFVAALRTDVREDDANPYRKAWLALALHGHSKETEARKTALAAEYAGLTGRDGYPSQLLYEVFGEEQPAVGASRGR